MPRDRFGTDTGLAVPEPIDEKQDTAVMEVVDPALIPVRDSTPSVIVDDGKQTTMMESVDLAALGLTTPSGQMPAVTDEQAAAASDGDDDDDKKPSSSGVRKRRRKR